MPETVEELVEMFRLRYHTYAAEGMIDWNPEEIDLDYYDQFSYQIALFKKEHEEDKIIGAVRLIVTDAGPQYTLVKSLTEQHPALKKYVTNDHPKAFPTFSYIPFLSDLQSFYNNHNIGNQQLLEGSRLCVIKSERVLSLSSFLLQCAICLSTVYLPGYNWIASARATHEAWYNAHGFFKVPGTPYFNYGAVGKACTLNGNYQQVPQSLKSRLDGLTAQYQKHGKIYLGHHNREGALPFAQQNMKLND
ncbi:MAG: GNAT family N-acetyltransferase [Saprospiraceae bacterium]|nr:GNAT family N-acetyltransferase [Saprospiraceae bacterium]